MATLTSIPLRDLMRSVIDAAEGDTAAREYRVTVYDRRKSQRISYTTTASSWYCCWQQAIEQHGVGCVITIRPVEPEGRPRLVLMP